MLVQQCKELEDKIRDEKQKEVSHNMEEYTSSRRKWWNRLGGILGFQEEDGREESGTTKCNYGQRWRVENQ